MMYDKERKENKELDIIHNLQVRTRVPSKYRLVDLETGIVYRPSNGKSKYQWIRDCCQDIIIRNK